MTVVKTTDDLLSSSDRARRHGEVRMLKAIKRKQKYQEPRKRKILKQGSGYGPNEEDLENEDDDIRDVDFRLYNNSAKLEVDKFFFLLLYLVINTKFKRRYCVLNQLTIYFSRLVVRKLIYVIGLMYCLDRKRVYLVSQYALHLST